MRSLIPGRIPGLSAPANALAAALLAPVCAVCDTVLDDPLSGCVCRECWTSIRPITPPICDACGDPLARQPQSPSSNPHALTHSDSPIVSHQSLCALCAGRRSPVDRARAIGEYDGALRDVIHALKYGGRRSLARPLGALMRSRGADVLSAADNVVPVPLHWTREYARGFNQARELARHLGLPILDALARRRRTRAQVELAADRRRANVADAFVLRRHWFRKPLLAGRCLVLVDDVSTTGATVESCACVLKGSGASEVLVLTAARVATSRRTTDSWRPGVQ